MQILRGIGPGMIASPAVSGPGSTEPGDVGNQAALRFSVAGVFLIPQGGWLCLILAEALALILGKPGAQGAMGIVLLQRCFG